ncbi:hypothetical protein LXL04_030148 [Taraxacum kok-saghyz]
MNYDTWKTLFERFCVSFGLQTHILEQPPTTRTPAWEKEDALLTLWLYGTLSPSLLPTVLEPSATTHDIWNTLQTLFQTNKDNRAIELNHELRTLELGDMSKAAYY